jgi:hypothetical protein
MSDTIRSRSNREVGQEVEGKTILEKKIVIAPDPANKRLGVYEYVVASRESEKRPVAASTASYVRQTPGERGLGVTRRVGTR